jgi:hypothetical protein
VFGKFFVWLFAIQVAAIASPPHPSLKAPPPPKLLLQIRVFPPAYAILASAFSPDERWIAILGEGFKEHKHAPTGIQSELLLFPGPAPGNQPLPHPVRIDLGVPILWGPVWSPRSDAVLVGGLAGRTLDVAKMFSIHGDQILARDAPVDPPLLIPSPRPAGEIFGFLDSSRLIAEVLAKHEPAAFATLDLHGKVTGTWPVSKKWTIAAISPERRLLAVYSDDERSKTLIVDYSSRKVIQSKANPTWLDRAGDRTLINAEFFTEAGRTLCTVGGAAGQARPAECWNVDTGKTIGEFRRFFGGSPAAASAHASRVVLTEFRESFRQGIDYYGDRVVWNFRSGAEIASWPAPGQAVGPDSVLRPSSVAISATGRLVAEGVNGILRVYELP